MIVIKINKCPFSLLTAISITKESPSKPRPWQAKARISKIESLFSCLLVPLHCTRSRNTRSLLQNLIRSTKGPGKARFYLKPLVEVNQAIISLVVSTFLSWSPRMHNLAFLFSVSSPGISLSTKTH